jgi:hypothetical protein
MMDGKDEDMNDSGSSSGDSTITMLSTSPSPPPGMASDPAFEGSIHGEHNHPHGHTRSPSGDNTVAMSGICGSPASSIARVPSFEEFMDMDKECHHSREGSVAASEASTIILPEVVDGILRGEEYPNQMALATPESQDLQDPNNFVVRHEHDPRFTCMCTGTCFVQENSGLATEIATVFPDKTGVELLQLNLPVVVNRFLTKNEERFYKLESKAGPVDTKGKNQEADERFDRDREGIAMLLEAHAYLSSVEAENNTDPQPLPGIMPSIEQDTNEQPSIIPNGVENEVDGDLEMETEGPGEHEHEQDHIDAAETDPDSDADVRSTSSNEYIPSSSPESSPER